LILPPLSNPDISHYTSSTSNIPTTTPSTHPTSSPFHIHESSSIIPLPTTTHSNIPQPLSTIHVPISSSSINSLQNVHPMKTRAKSKISKPKMWTYVLVDIFPSTVNDALATPEQNDATQLKYNALLTNNMSHLIDPPPHSHIIGCKWDFKNKFHKDGSLTEKGSFRGLWI